MLLVGILLVAGLGVILVEAVGYRRGGYDSSFWRLSLDDKLDHVADHRRDWWWISVWGLVGILVMTAGVAGLTYLLADAGEPVLAYVSLGGYLVALIAWVLALIVQTAAVAQAAAERSDTGTTPSWMHPLWNAAYFAEAVWVIGTNLAFAVSGVAILQTGLVGAWAGWAALGLGVLIPIGVAVSRTGFPQLGELVPFIIGVALLIESF